MDDAEAFAWMKLAADAGHVRAMAEVGVMYSHGAPLRSQRIWGSTVFLVWACGPAHFFAGRKARQACFLGLFLAGPACFLRSISRQMLLFLFLDLPAWRDVARCRGEGSA
jgi:TPR repeat protein